MYDFNGGKNTRPFVSITYNEVTNSYTWKNKAGVTWTLFPSKDSDTLKVGKDCPYYANGYKTAKFNQMGIYGPGNEFYIKTGRFYIYTPDLFKFQIYLFNGIDFKLFVLKNFK